MPLYQKKPPEKDIGKKLEDKTGEGRKDEKSTGEGCTEKITTHGEQGKKEGGWGRP